MRPDLMSVDVDMITDLESANQSSDVAMSQTKRSDDFQTYSSICSLLEGQDAVFWDHDLSGFGVRVYPSGRKVYVVQSRGPSGPKRVTLGQHGELAADQARKKAAGVIDRIKQGEDPVPAPAITLADLAERYMRAHVAVNCNAHTAGIYRGSLDTISCRRWERWL